MTEYPEVAREEVAGCGSPDALKNGQQEQEQEQESRLYVCVRKSMEEVDEPYCFPLNMCARDERRRYPFDSLWQSG